jgi:hypothetical protein
VNEVTCGRCKQRMERMPDRDYLMMQSPTGRIIHAAVRDVNDNKTLCAINMYAWTVRGVVYARST